MELMFMGTGDAQQVPLTGCDCIACERARLDPRFRRGPSSMLVRCDGEATLLDAGVTQLEQRFGVNEIRRILLTHYHVDHVQGLFSLRWGIGDRIPVFGPPDEQGCDDLYKHPRRLDFQPAMTPFQPVAMGALRVTALPLNHSKPTFGYLLEQDGQAVAYLTDTCGLPNDTLDFLRGKRLDHMVMDCTQPPRDQPPLNHSDLNTVLRVREQLRPTQTWLTHVSHETDVWLMLNDLPDGVRAAADGAWINV
ncbi:phosphonate metabolism protein PhnP [Dickeya fangzhongdai]|uniref:phosphonate metabolism protein PhnP n=1 Tax=Dickeya fangzhongdai TaxID=1778540 RepID=UPI0026E0ACCD|nr:phosphonate metabolism protein PhnP [Dickeya fangzhongdai]WKV51619.1 phosphonate metabolism protein PhnP [Dickeya fangzhongdai]